MNPSEESDTKAEHTSPRTILVVGSANADLVVRVPHTPKPGETVIGGDFETLPGGKGANQAVAAARLGANTHFAGCIGDDSFGKFLRETLTQAGIQIDHLHEHPQKGTGTAFITVADNGQNSIVVAPAANFAFTPDKVEALKPLLSQTDVILLQLEIPLETVAAMLQMARSSGVTTILDAGPARTLPREVLRLADVVSPNETEAAHLTGTPVSSLDDARRAAAELLELGAPEVVLKLGAGGTLHAKDTFLHVPAFSINAIDTVAAGDAFTAGLALKWGLEPLPQALRFANACGAVASTVRGAQPSMPTRAAVEEFLSAV